MADETPLGCSGCAEGTLQAYSETSHDGFDQLNLKCPACGARGAIVLDDGPQRTVGPALAGTDAEDVVAAARATKYSRTTASDTMERLNGRIPTWDAEAIEALVEEGQFESASEAMRTAIAEMLQRRGVADPGADPDFAGVIHG